MNNFEWPVKGVMDYIDGEICFYDGNAWVPIRLSPQYVAGFNYAIERSMELLDDEIMNIRLSMQDLGSVTDERRKHNLDMIGALKYAIDLLRTNLANNK